jgi:hypothetical protein
MRVRSLLLSAMTVASTVTVLQSPASAAVQGPYFIHTNHTGGQKCLGLAHNSTANSTQVEQQDCDHLSPAQKWVFIDTTNGYYRIRNVASGKCLNVQGRSTANGAKLIIYPCGVSNSSNDQWFPLYNFTDWVCGIRYCDFGDYYQLKPRHAAGKCANVQGASQNSGADLIQHQCNSASYYNELFSWQFYAQNVPST